MERKEKRPIGIFDSGVGGLTVFKEIVKKISSENIIYFGDTARLPYGTKSKETVIKFSREILEFLLDKKVKMVVVACNTASSLALDDLRSISPVPMIGVIEPGVKELVNQTKTGVVGVIGTRSTIHSNIYTKKIRELNPEIKVYAKACPLFVPLIEEGLIDNEITAKTIEHYLKELKETGLDTLLLGCTHYPLIKDNISKYFNDRVKIIDSASVVVKEVEMTLHRLDLKNHSLNDGSRYFYLSDESEYFHKLASNFLGFYPEPTYYRL
ncbi:MAG: glutamate racemase [Candidatus Hydrogenedentota bacterium]